MQRLRRLPAQLTEEEQKVFLESITAFNDAFMRFDLKTGMAYVYKDRIVPKLENTVQPCAVVIHEMTSVVEEFSLSTFLGAVQLEHVRALKVPEVLILRCFMNDACHHVEMLLTPILDETGVCCTFYLTAKDLESEITRDAKLLQEKIKENESLIFQSRENLDILNELLGVGVWQMTYDKDGNLKSVHWSRSFREMLGYESDREFPNVLSSWMNSIHSEDRERIIASYHRCIEENAPFDEHYRMKKKNGVCNVFHATARPAFYPNGKVRILLGTFINETMLDDASKEMNERLDAVLSGVAGGIVITHFDPQYTVHYISDEIAKNLGYTKEEFLELYGNSMRSVCYPADLPNVDRAVNEQLKTGDMFFMKYRAMHKDGSLRWLQSSAKIVLQADGTSMVYSLVQDITDKETTEQQLRAERLQYRDALRKDAVFSFGFDVTDGYVRDNIEHDPEIDFLTRRAASLPISFDLMSQFYQEDYGVQFLDKKSSLCFSCAGLLQLFREGKTLAAVDYYSAKTDHYTRILALLSENPITGHVRCMVIGTNVTEKRKEELRQQQALRDALAAMDQANAAKSAFFANMSHDIRTPMNAIIGMTAIAASNVEDTDRVQDCLSKITMASKHLLGLINEVLDMSKIESGKTELQEEPFSIAALIDSMLVMTHVAIKERHHTLHIAIKDLTHEEVVGDGQRLQQVFMNLLSNAIKYTPEGGTINVSISEKASGLMGVGLYTAVFEDNGLGMSEEFQRDLFKPFSRANDERVQNQQGTGLGMVLVKNIINMMNGSIQVESKLNEGSKFTITFFLKYQKEENVTYEDFIELPVLVADDDKDACMTVCALLNDLKMRADGVYSGAAAVERVVERHENNEDYFAVILDWKMPGMDGVETARAIRAKVGRDVPIIVLSAYDWSEIEVEARKAGVDAFVSKPLFKSRLIQLFNGFLHKEEVVKEEPTLDDLKAFDYSTKRALIVEDNFINMEIAKAIIGNTKIQMEFAKNGKEAVDIVMEKPENHYDIIFMDIQMPVMNGYEATRGIRALPKAYARQVPIVAMTANAFVEDIRMAKTAGMNGHLAKPLDIAHLMEVFRKWFW